MKRDSNTSSRSSISTDASAEINQNRNRGMTLPFDQHTITFDEIKYSVDMPQVTCNI